MRLHELTEVTLIPGVKKKGRGNSYQLPNSGRPIPDSRKEIEMGKFISKVSGGYEIWLDHLSGFPAYNLYDPETKRGILSVFGTRFKNNPNSLKIMGTYANSNNPVRASEFYYILITKLGLTLVSDKLQSPGGQAVWKQLEKKHRDVNIFGWDMKANKPVNVSTRDEEDTHVPAGDKKVNRDMQYTANNIRMVATAK